MCSQIDKANVRTNITKPISKKLSGTHRALKFNIAQYNERMSVLSYVSQNGETMKNIFSGHIKMNYSCGGHKHSALLLYLQVNGKYTNYHIDCFLPQ